MTLESEGIRIFRPKKVTQVYTRARLAASASDLSSPIDLTGVSRLALTVRAKCNAGATAGLSVFIYTTPDHKNWDTVELTSFSISVSAGNNIQKTVYIDPDAQEIRLKVTNSDTAQALTDVKMWVILTY